MCYRDMATANTVAATLPTTTTAAATAVPVAVNVAAVGIFTTTFTITSPPHHSSLPTTSAPHSYTICISVNDVIASPAKVAAAVATAGTSGSEDWKGLPVLPGVQAPPLGMEGDTRDDRVVDPDMALEQCGDWGFVSTTAIHTTTHCSLRLTFVTLLSSSHCHISYHITS
jgi:hypothetical protein